MTSLEKIGTSYLFFYGFIGAFIFIAVLFFLRRNKGMKGEVAMEI
jgi:hypothetical protein